MYATVNLNTYKKRAYTIVYNSSQEGVLSAFIFKFKKDAIKRAKIREQQLSKKYKIKYHSTIKEV